MKLKCPLPECNNEVDIILKEGDLYWIDKIIPTHNGKIMELPSPYKEEFLGYAYEKGLLNNIQKENQKITSIEYSTANQKVNVKKEIPYDAVMLLSLGIMFLVFSFIPFIEFSSVVLYVLSFAFISSSLIEYFALY